MKSKLFLVLFFGALVADLCVLGAALSLQFRYFTKPAIIIFLLCYFLSYRYSNKSQKRYLVLALIFSLIGDVLLLFSEVEGYFIGGLLAFLLAHLMYIIAFFRINYLQTRSTLLITSTLLIYALGIFYLIQPKLGQLLPYVVIYMLVLLSMVLIVARRKKTSNLSYYLVLTGALLFMFSDTFLALNKFYIPFEVADVLIMLTYGLAQFLIIYGVLVSQNVRPNLS